jgi:hypothetical protein
MDFLLKLLEAPPEVTGYFQLALDIVILALLAMVFFEKKKKSVRGNDELLQTFGRILDETQTISKEFEVNLEQRQLLLQQITAKLDQRIAEAQQVVARLGELAAAPPRDGSEGDSGMGIPKSQDQRQVLSLARKGLDATQIARQLRKPVGEVELILSLQKISS